ncbi:MULTISPECIES: MBL fold metallo-hydrolase [unclassified Paenibacillus]|uniref:MBL fold metallo-hydrolase n=1 Tax=unclassified Paenibacillus TaxID=185978 RepID=UPI003635992A
MTESLTFYGGLTTIGGVHIVYGCGDTGLVFDLGMTWGLYAGETRIQPEHGIRNYLLTRMAPPVTGLYHPDYLGDVGEAELKGVWGKESLPSFDKLHGFVSHIHQDHMALLPALRPGIPVWMHRDAQAVYRAVIAAGEYGDTQADIHTVQDREIVNFGAFSVEFIEVDHDTPGVTGFIIHGPKYKIAFTADWRRHGRHPYRIDGFIERCRSAKVDVLITEGTRLRPDTLFRKPKDRFEQNIAVECRRAMEDTNGLVYVNILARNVERVADLIVRTREAGRTLVMDESTAVLWHEAGPNVEVLRNHPALEIDRDIIRVLKNPEWSKGPQPKESVELPYKTITISEITTNRRQYAVYLIYPHTPLLAELESMGEQGCTAPIYVHADGNPLTPTDETLHRWLKEFGVDYRYCATGGHAAPQEIADMAEAIDPRILIPLHSVHPTLLDSRGVKRYYPTPGESITLDQLVGQVTSV